jgi:voltage-gated sodium channel
MLQRFFMTERNMMAAIILNAVVIYLLYFPEIPYRPALETLDHFFIAVFVAEALIKLTVLKPKAYFADRWNIFDFTIVLLSLPTVLMYALPVQDTSILLVLRMFRLVRLVRFLRFVPHMAMILQGLGRALRASLFVLLALFFLNVMLALFTCHFYGDLLPDQFGNPLVSSFTIFQLFTIEGWYEIPLAVDEASESGIVRGVSRVYFIGVVLIGGIFGMSLANAIFVDEMTIDNTRVVEEKMNVMQQQMTELKQLLEESLGKSDIENGNGAA